MKLLVVVALCALAFAAPRQKRMTFGTIAISTNGGAGSTGCVVTGNVLYINGFKQRELTSSEQQEMQQYQQDIDAYKQEVKDAIAAKQKAFEERMKSGRRNVGAVARNNNSNNNSTDLPKPPAKPSFCNAEDTTQYIFDGCMIQNNKVYVGRDYARDLSDEEIQELKDFDEKQTVYQNYVQQQVQKQVNSIFSSSDLFSALFNDGPADQQTTTRASVTTEGPAPEAPKVPDFCTAIY